ncbi:MAG: ArsB/NhaD family transporter [Clostridiales bacterium]|jgi:Na+/H+ antiporter NhaD/arsenite permease-like protein|nr:ArsB/NhaD family transporter [Clostridiales bacterium]
MAIISIVVFLAVIITIMTEKVHRTAAALAGAVVLILAGVVSSEKALSYIDFNTIGVLFGMMVFVAVARSSGMFEYIAIKAAKAVKGDPWKLMVVFMLITALLSSILDNVTTVLLIGPMTLAITKMLEVNPVPFLMTQVFASNIGGTATLIGDPPNILIGSAANLSFIDFVVNTGPPILIIILAMIVVMKFRYKKELATSNTDIDKVMHLDEQKSVSDPRLMKLTLIIVVAVVLGFIFHDRIGVDSSVIALTAGALMLLIGRQNVENMIADVEWTTLVFFMALFVVVGGLVETGVIGKLSSLLISLTSGHQIATMLVILWASALLSSVLDNIPFVATMIPLITALGSAGMDISSFWWALSLGACLGGNGTMIGASANVVISDISNKHGYPITFKSFTKEGFPLMILSIVISTVYLVVRYGM